MFGDYQFNQPLFNDVNAQTKVVQSGGGIVGAIIWFFRNIIMKRGR